MENEIEAQFLDIDKDKLREKLNKAGAKLIRPEVLMKRTVFYTGEHSFVRKDSDKLPKVSFQVFPSRAIGNTVLAAFADEAEAMNNLAVLLYAEVANAYAYKEAVVIDLLKRAAAKGCATARRNLEVLRSNRGERSVVLDETCDK